MFLTFIPQYLNKLVEIKGRDFTSTQAFHTVKVQRLNDNRIKRRAKFCRKFPMEVFALIKECIRFAKNRQVAFAQVQEIRFLSRGDVAVTRKKSYILNWGIPFPCVCSL